MLPTIQTLKLPTPDFITGNTGCSLTPDGVADLHKEALPPFATANALINAQEAERADMANRLSEHISQILVASRLYIECAMNDDGQRLVLLEESRNLVVTALKEISTLAKWLSPVSLKEAGLLETINELADDTSQLTGISFKTCWDGFKEELPDEKLKLTLFRVIQEYLKFLVVNTRPANIEIRITCRKGGLQLRILDNGTAMHRPALKKELFFQHIQRRCLLHHGKTPVYRPGPAKNSLNLRFPL